MYFCYNLCFTGKKVYKTQLFKKSLPFDILLMQHLYLLIEICTYYICVFLCLIFGIVFITVIQYISYTSRLSSINFDSLVWHIKKKSSLNVSSGLVMSLYFVTIPLYALSHKVHKPYQLIYFFCKILIFAIVHLQ